MQPQRLSTVKYIKKLLEHYIDIGINYIDTFAESTSGANTINIYILEYEEDPVTSQRERERQRRNK